MSTDNFKNSNKPKILIVTQKVDINDGVLGFFHGWLEKLAEKADLFVVANYVGEHKLPDNVRIFSLGKEKGAGKVSKFFRYQRALMKLLPKVNGVFFHMCPEYVVGAGLWPKIFRKKTLLWYTHKAVNWKLKLAEKLVDKIFTASKESFRLPSKKVEITGHGIDVEKFKPKTEKGKTEYKNTKFKIISVGRISPVKNYDLLVDAAEILKNKNMDYDIKIAGAPILDSDKVYFERLKEKIKEKKLEDRIKFVGPIPNKDIADFYREGDLFVNFSDTGSLDKAVLEAMASGLEILTSNEAFKNILKNQNIVNGNAEEIVSKIIDIFKQYQKPELKYYVMINHSLESLVLKIKNYYI